MEVRYFGWSGVAVAGAGGVVAVDPFGAAVRWENLDAETTVLCVSHGHPEHCGSVRQLLAEASADRLAATHLVSSAPVVEHIARDAPIPSHHQHPLAAGEHVQLDGLRVTAFGWKHLPLLPPEGLRAKAGHVRSLLRHPLEALRIGIAGARLPMRAPYLGFHLVFRDGRTALNYSEGLHRLTDPDEVASVARRLWAETLIFAVEPEDVDAIPRWIEVLHPAEIVLYEAHRPWRELFRLPYVDLHEYGASLRSRFPGTAVRVLNEPGRRVTIGGDR